VVVFIVMVLAVVLGSQLAFRFAFQLPIASFTSFDVDRAGNSRVRHFQQMSQISCSSFGSSPAGGDTPFGHQKS
jgi:hypothetical protein